MRSIILLFCLVFLSITSCSVAKNQHSPINNTGLNYLLLSENWYLFQNKEPGLNPLLNAKSTYQSAFLWLDIWKYRNNYLCFNVKKDLTLFVDNKLYTIFKEDAQQFILLNNVIKKMNLHFNRRAVLLGFWNEKGNLPFNSTYILFGNKREILHSELKTKPAFNQFRYSLVLLLILVLIISAGIKLFFPVSLSRTFTLLKGLPSKNLIFKDHTEIVNPYTLLGGTGFMLMVGITLYLAIYRGVIITEFIWIKAGFWLNLGYLTGLIFFPFLIIYITVFIFSIVYKIQKSSLTGFLYSINFNILCGFFLFLFLISYLIFPVIYFKVLFKIELFLFLLFLVIKFFYLFFVLLKNYKFNKLHLFFYLCALEVLPLLFIYKILNIQFG